MQFSNGTKNPPTGNDPYRRFAFYSSISFNITVPAASAPAIQYPPSIFSHCSPSAGRRSPVLWTRTLSGNQVRQIPAGSSRTFVPSSQTIPAYPG